MVAQRCSTIALAIQAQNNVAMRTHNASRSHQSGQTRRHAPEETEHEQAQQATRTTHGTETRPSLMRFWQPPHRAHGSLNDFTLPLRHAAIASQEQQKQVVVHIERQVVQQNMGRHRPECQQEGMIALLVGHSRHARPQRDQARHIHPTAFHERTHEQDVNIKVLRRVHNLSILIEAVAHKRHELSECRNTIFAHHLVRPPQTRAHRSIQLYRKRRLRPSHPAIHQGSHHRNREHDDERPREAYPQPIHAFVEHTPPAQQQRPRNEEYGDAKRKPRVGKNKRKRIDCEEQGALRQREPLSAKRTHHARKTKQILGREQCVGKAHAMTRSASLIQNDVVNHARRSRDKHHHKRTCKHPSAKPQGSSRIEVPRAQNKQQHTNVGMYFSANGV